MTLYDKNKRPIKVGDVLKVYHFTGKRNKKHYMYKYVYDKVTYPAGHTLYHILHLGSNPDELLKSKYYEEDINGIVLDKYEIVQGIRTIDGVLEDVNDRPKLKMHENSYRGMGTCLHHEHVIYQDDPESEYEKCYDYCHKKKHAVKNRHCENCEFWEDGFGLEKEYKLQNDNNV